MRVSSPAAKRHLGVNVRVFDVDTQYSRFRYELETAPDLFGLIVGAQKDAEVVGFVGILLGELWRCNVVDTGDDAAARA